MFDDQVASRLFEEGFQLLEKEGLEPAARAWERIFALEPSAKDLRAFAERTRAARNSLKKRRASGVQRSVEEPSLLAEESLAASSVADLERLVTENPGDSGILLRIGSVLVQKDDTDRARRILLSAAKCDPSAPAPLARLAGLETREGRHGRAGELARQALELDPFDSEAYRALLISSALSGDEETVRRFAARARVVLDDDAFVDRLVDEAARRSAAALVRFTGGDGRDTRHAIQIEGARSSEVGVCAERLYAERLLGPEWEIEGQSFIEEDGRFLDCLLFQRNAETRKLYFDVTPFFADDRVRFSEGW